MIINFIIDQLLNWFIESNYRELGEDDVFKLWWGFHLLELLEIHLFANIIIIRNIPSIDQFNGYVGRRFPGQDKPRSVLFQPKRDFHQLTKHIEKVWVEQGAQKTNPHVSRKMTILRVEIH